MEASRRLWAVAAGTLLVVSCAVPSGGDPPLPADAWPMFRGPHGLGVAHHDRAPLAWNGRAGKPAENIRWKVPIPKRGTSSPIAWGKRVFVTGADEASRDVYAFEAETGALSWTHEVKEAPGPLPRVMEDVTYAPATMATDGERVYAIFATGDLVALSMEGKKIWGLSLGVPKNAYGHASSLATYGGRVLVQFDSQSGGRLLALDAATGHKAWEERRDVTDSWASPALVKTDAGMEAILVALPNVISHDPLTGKIRWSVKCMDGEPTPSPASANGIVFVATERAKLTAIREGKILWQYDEDLPSVSSPVARGRFLLMASEGGVVTCLETGTGTVLWRREFDEGFLSSPVIVGERVYLMDRKGVTFVFKLADRYEELHRNELGEKSTCTPAFPEGRIYIRTDRHLYCIGGSGP